tara:strand:+ start:529 stop:801 length:273 start_codon:yes stop_codon:yes gene_type:complete
MRMFNGECSDISGICSDTVNGSSEENKRYGTIRLLNIKKLHFWLKKTYLFLIGDHQSGSLNLAEIISIKEAINNLCNPWLIFLVLKIYTL